MKIRQRIAGIVTAMVCAACIFSANKPLIIFAADSTYGELSYKTLDSNGDGTNDYVKITGCNETTVKLDIPNKIEGLPVKEIGDFAFSEHASLESVTIPDGVTTLGISVFWDCLNLSDVTLPESAINIGHSTFRDCESLETITLPSGLTEINDMMFNECINLKNITIPESVTSIGDYAFKSCSSLTKITIPEKVTKIGDLAFAYCTKIAYIYIPESVNLIDMYCFMGCLNMDRIVIENPDCEIYDAKNTIPEHITIYSHENSTAQKYAEEYGCEFTLINENHLIGDVNQNGVIDLYDAIEICRYIMSMRTFTDEEKTIADFDGNNVVDLYDAVGIAKELLPK